MTNKGLNLLMNVLLNVFICALRKKSAPLFPEAKVTIHTWHHRKFTEDANQNKQKWCYCQSKNFRGASDNVRYLKTFRIISNDMLVLLLILC